MATTLLNRYQSDPNVQIVTGVCPHDCPDSCSWQVAVDRATGRALDIWGHPEHPVTAWRTLHQGGPLSRAHLSPRPPDDALKRTGVKGEGRFMPVSWDEAIDGIAARLQETITRYGAESVLPYSYAGTMGLLQGEGMAQRFFNRMGASQLARTICSVAGGEGYAYTIGATEGMETEAFARAKLILIWGSNTLTSNMHLWPFVQQAKNAGARAVVIDPAHAHSPLPASGSRCAPARTPRRLAMMHVIIGEGLIDADYVERYTFGFDALAARVAEWTPERAAEITGAPAERIRELARAYATTRPAAIRVNYGLQRHAGGGMAARTVACLPAGRRMARPRRRHPVERQRRFPSYGPHRATQAGSAHRRTAHPQHDPPGRRPQPGPGSHRPLPSSPAPRRRGDPARRRYRPSKR